MTRSTRAWIGAIGVLLLLSLLVAAGCSRKASKPTDDSVNLINAQYPVHIAGDQGWDYAKTLPYDLDGDGAEEKLMLIANVQWVDAQSTFAWDDGHNWQVYVEESDGTRTYLFDNWVQMGKLQAMVESDTHDVLLQVQSGTMGLMLYRVTYQQGKAPVAHLLAEIGAVRFAGFTDPRYHE